MELSTSSIATALPHLAFLFFLGLLFISFLQFFLYFHFSSFVVFLLLFQHSLLFCFLFLSPEFYCLLFGRGLEHTFASHLVATDSFHGTFLPSCLVKNSFIHIDVLCSTAFSDPGTRCSFCSYSHGCQDQGKHVGLPGLHHITDQHLQGSHHFTDQSLLVPHHLTDQPLSEHHHLTYQGLLGPHQLKAISQTRACKDCTLSQPQACLLYMLICNNCCLCLFLPFISRFLLFSMSFPFIAQQLYYCIYLFGFRYCPLFSLAVLFPET